MRSRIKGSALNNPMGGLMPCKKHSAYTSRRYDSFYKDYKTCKTCRGNYEYSRGESVLNNGYTLEEFHKLIDDMWNRCIEDELTPLRISFEEDTSQCYYESDIASILLIVETDHKGLT